MADAACHGPTRSPPRLPEMIGSRRAPAAQLLGYGMDELRLIGSVAMGE